MKKLISFILISVLLFSFSVSAQNEISVYFDGSQLEFDTQPLIKDDRVLVPLRKIFEAFGANVNYNPDSKTVIAIKGDITVSICIGSNKLYKNNEEIIMDTTAEIVNSRTLIPLRAVSSAFDYDVNWAADSRSVSINTKNNIVNCNTARDFVNSIASYTTVNLEKAEYILSDFAGDDIDNENIHFNEVFDGYEILIENVDNLTIKGKLSQLLVKPRYAYVLKFVNCENITIDNVIAGHTDSDGYCTGGVMCFENCKAVNIKNCDFFGCGTYGIDCMDCENFNVKDTVIHDCTQGGAVLYKCKSFVFNGCRFEKCECYSSVINIVECEDISIDYCSISYNNAEKFLDVFMSKKLYVNHCTFDDNTFEFPTEYDGNNILITK